MSATGCESQGANWMSVSFKVCWSIFRNRRRWIGEIFVCQVVIPKLPFHHCCVITTIHFIIWKKRNISSFAIIIIQHYHALTSSSGVVNSWAYTSLIETSSNIALVIKVVAIQARVQQNKTSCFNECEISVTFILTKF